MESEMDVEMRFHIEAYAEDLIRSGVPREEALRQARIEFGGIEGVKEECRDARGVNLVESVLQDVRYGLRMLRKSPGFTAVAVLTLALGIGANTAIFTLVHAVMLQTLPVRNPSELYRLGNDNRMCCEMSGLEGRYTLFSKALYDQLRDNTPEFSELTAFQAEAPALSLRRNGAQGDSRVGHAEYVSGNYFQTFGLSPVRGRLLSPTDDTPAAPPVAVMSYRAWHDFYGSDPSIIGSAFTVNAISLTIVGVAPAGFYGDTLRSDPPDIWMPVAMEALEGKTVVDRPDVQWLFLIGRMKPGERASQVQAHVTTEVQQWLSAQSFLNAEDRRDITRQKVILESAAGGVNSLRESYQSGLLVLTIISGLVLLIACANVASLLLERAMGSRLQTAVRIALGATRGRLIRQMVTEGVLLGLLGGAAGLVLAFGGTRALLLLAFRGAHYVPIDAGPSLPILVFTLAMSLLTGVVFATVPAWMSSQTNPNEALRSVRSTRDRSPFARKSLVVLQTALSLALLAGAGLLVETLHNLEHQKWGFVANGRLIIHVDPALAGYTVDRLPQLYSQIERRFEALPGVLSASYSTHSPMDGWNSGAWITVAGNSEFNAGVAKSPSLLRVGPHYFQTVGTRLLRGRVIDEHDTAKSRFVAVVNETFARQFFPKQDPLGKTFGIHGDVGHSHDFEIVGIVEDAKYQNARQPAYATYFVPFFQDPIYKDASTAIDLTSFDFIKDIELDVAGDPSRMQSTVREVLPNIDPNLVPLKILSLADQVSLNFNEEHLVSRLTVFYGLLALVLATIGLYGVVAYMVVRRTSEMGVRMALGAQPWDIFRAVLREGGLLTLIGIAIGLGAALGLARLMSALLYGVAFTDVWIFAAAASILAGAGFAACYIPARRAMLVDPMTALRHE
jgi:macrolide transport system ATP-binding/permease protein